MHRAGHVGHSIGSTLRRTSLVPVVSDFLFDDAETVLQDLAHLNAVHDVFIVIVDASAAYRPAARVGRLDSGPRRRERPPAAAVARGGEAAGGPDPGLAGPGRASRRGA